MPVRLREVRRAARGAGLWVATTICLCSCYGYIGGPAVGGSAADQGGTGFDGGVHDTGLPTVDAGQPADAGAPPLDAGPDAGPVDGAADAGRTDTGDASSPPISQCNDGIDNDGDGLVDWELDLGCWGPGDGTEGGLNNQLDNGWTVFEPSSDTRIIYVSDSSGDDAWSGLAPEFDGTNGPKKTVRAGISQLRDGRPDWLLFKRGDVWVDQRLGNWPISGRSEQEAAVIASYGASTVRPRFDVSESWLMTIDGGGVSQNRAHLRILGMHVRSYSRDPDDARFSGIGGSCLQWLHGGGDVLVEDTKCEFAQVNLQGSPTLPFTFRRCVLTESYSLNSHAQGIFSLITAPLIMEENIINHGGWSERFRLGLWNPQSNPATWAAIRDGRVRIILGGQTLDLSGLDFGGVSSMNQVAGIIEASINTALGTNAVQLLYTQGGAFQLRAPTLPATQDYQVLTYGGTTPGTELEPLLVGADPLGSGDAQGTPNSTIFNRNLYIANGYGRTVARGNIDANGSSGGTQFRMGGIYEDNLSLRNPHALVFGHEENPGNTQVGGLIRNNVALGSRNISTQRQGKGYQIVSAAATTINGGPSTVQNLEISGNILAHNVLGDVNINGILLQGNGAHRDVQVHNNLIYKWALPSWRDPLDQRAFGLNLQMVVPSSNIEVFDNVIQQASGGFAVASESWVSGLRLSNNTYYSAAPNPPDRWSRGWYSLGSSVTVAEWSAGTGETGLTEARLNYVDPERGVETYMASLGRPATYEAFIDAATQQSKLAWRPELTAAAVNAYIRDGFRIDTSR